MIHMVREGGGIGDCLCVGAAASFIACSSGEEITVWAPADFREVYRHLHGVSAVQCPWSLKSLQGLRRPKDAPLDGDAYPYLRAIPPQALASAVDLWCPAVQEETEEGFPRARAVIFAEAAARQTSSLVDPDLACSARPLWVPRPQEALSPGVSGLRDELDRQWPGRPTIGLALRGTRLERTYPAVLAEDLQRLLVEAGYRALAIDCIMPHYELRAGTVAVQAPLTDLAVALPHCLLVVCVDSAILHLCAALNVRALGLFGPTLPRTIEPYPLATGLRGEAPEGCTASCYTRPERKTHEMEALDCPVLGCGRLASIEPEQIARQVHQVLGGRSPGLCRGLHR